MFLFSVSLAIAADAGVIAFIDLSTQISSCLRVFIRVRVHLTRLERITEPDCIVACVRS